jgi:hypothetical protein
VLKNRSLNFIEAVNNFEDEIFQSFTKYFIPCVVYTCIIGSKAI